MVSAINSHVIDHKTSFTLETLCSSILDPTKHANIIVKADSGASNNYWRTEYHLFLTDINYTHNGSTVQLPNNAIMSVTHTGHIPVSISLSPHEKNVHVFDVLHSALLASLGQLYDDDCIAIFYNNEINITKNSKIILKEQQNKSDGLCDIPMSKPLRHREYSIITRDKTKTDIIQYLHGCCFSPMPIKFLKAIKNGIFLTWPGLNNQILLKYLPPSIATALGHLDQ